MATAFADLSIQANRFLESLLDPGRLHVVKCSDERCLWELKTGERTLMVFRKLIVTVGLMGGLVFASILLASVPMTAL
jgi:hypothetical protein